MPFPRQDGSRGWRGYHLRLLRGADAPRCAGRRPGGRSRWRGGRGAPQPWGPERRCPPARPAARVSVCGGRGRARGLRGGCAGPGTRRVRGARDAAVRGGEGAVRLLWPRFARAVSESCTFHFPPPWRRPVVCRGWRGRRRGRFCASLPAASG